MPREKGAAPGLNPQQKQQQADDYQLMEQVTRFFQHQLKVHPQASKAIDYLKARGLSGEIVKQWEIGYAPPEWDTVLNTFGKSQTQQQQLFDLKLITENDNRRRYDFFRDRIMFPIRDKRGRVIGFGGRVLGDGSPKYLNSPETRIFHKGHELYALFQARQAHRKLQQMLIVEGYMDVVALSQYDINYAVASLGTATTPEQLQTLFRTSDRIICCYDGDRAGREAAWRALQNALPHLKDNIEMKFLFLPDGEDPDSLVRQIGKAALQQKFAEAIPLSRFFFENLLQRHHLGSNEGKAALKAEATPLIEQIRAENQRSLLESELSKHMGEQNRYILQRDVAKANSKRNTVRQDNSKLAKTQTSPIRMMLRLLMDDPSLVSRCPEVDMSMLADMQIAGKEMLLEVQGYCHQYPDANTAQLLENFRYHPHIKHLSKLLTMELLIKQETSQQVYQDSFAKLLDWYFLSRYEELLAKSRVSQLSEDEKQELNLLIKEHKH